MADEKRLIDAKPLMESGWHLVKTGENNKFLAQMSLADVPAVKAVEVVHGEWRCVSLDPQDPYFVCSHCRIGYSTIYHECEEMKYCPNCGAKMNGVNKDG